MAVSVGGPPLWSSVVALSSGLKRLWRHDLIRLVGLTVYYVAIITALAVVYGGAEYTPPPFVYQGF